LHPGLYLTIEAGSQNHSLNQPLTTWQGFRGGKERSASTITEFGARSPVVSTAYASSTASSGLHCPGLAVGHQHRKTPSYQRLARLFERASLAVGCCHLFRSQLKLMPTARFGGAAHDDIVTIGNRPRLRSTMINLAFSNAVSARDFAARSIPKGSSSAFPKVTVPFPMAPLSRHKHNPMIKALPGSSEARIIHSHGTGPLRNRLRRCRTLVEDPPGRPPSTKTGSAVEINCLAALSHVKGRSCTGCREYVTIHTPKILHRR
jgi:hypothetical protein